MLSLGGQAITCLQATSNAEGAAIRCGRVESDALDALTKHGDVKAVPSQAVYANDTVKIGHSPDS